MALDLIQYEGRFHSAMLRAFGGHLIAANDQVITSSRILSIYLCTTYIYQQRSSMKFQEKHP